jgi:YHS domain-containing protein
MWKSSTQDAKSLHVAHQLIALFLGALALFVLFSVWLMAEPINRTTEPTPPQSSAETDTTWIGMTTSTEHLSAAERKAALAQGRCPVMGIMLIDTDTPVKINHDGQIFFVCCPACVPIFEGNPDRYLANLQGTCPVTGKNLINVEHPCKVMYHGRAVYVSCEKSKADFCANPDKYMENKKFY